ncbi:3-hydroxybutyrate dehydrogenase [Croceicoccus sp. F390]|uniref:3-hydroxybutyrate dehydrogenase n=1 Tax=Croceicoccus esteveae TaxID=3075597 RepID=A0ABU2ZFM5_9SPHN|nr:3-hydroxybutyrate dehydrogenase [Croceicoccus sp. F390]MDT0574878.1 3-hydroxybutyrate dehydrogenase [Croceicoccus sp. F390]
MQMFLKGKTALVTGSTSGIGLAIAYALAGAGADLVITGIGEPDEMEDARRSLADRHRVKAICLNVDLITREGTHAMVEAARDAFGHVDILVNNAGMQHVAPVDEFPPERWDQIIALNLTAAFDACRLCIPMMKARGWGRIINTASAHSTTASPFKAAYVSAKHGLAGLTKTIALELAQHNITANCISPGYVWTPLVENQIPDTMKARGLSREAVINDVLLSGQPTKKFSQPEDIAALAVFLCRDEAQNMTGSNIAVDGGWTAQ